MNNNLLSRISMFMAICLFAVSLVACRRSSSEKPTTYNEQAAAEWTAEMATIQKGDIVMCHDGMWRLVMAHNGSRNGCGIGIKSFSEPAITYLSCKEAAETIEKIVYRDGDALYFEEVSKKLVMQAGGPRESDK